MTTSLAAAAAAAAAGDGPEVGCQGSSAEGAHHNRPTRGAAALTHPNWGRVGG
jgi:hypothetical protein